MTAPAGSAPAVERRRVSAAGVELDVGLAGPPDGPVVVLLHGFPEFSYGWHRQVGALAAAGLRVVVPDQRGYARSAKPEGIAAYGLDRLADDVAALADVVGARRFTLVGHDWGGLVAWWTALTHADRVERLAILNAPHPAAMRAYLAEHPSQRKKSWYIGFFQLPWLPEFWLSRNDCAWLRRTLVASSRPGTFSDADLARYVAAWREPGALTGSINWYRALRRARPAKRDPRVRCPVRILWGRRDAFLEVGLAEASLALCDRAELRVFAAATHWLQHEEAAAINAELIAFARGEPPPA